MEHRSTGLASLAFTAAFAIVASFFFAVSSVSMAAEGIYGESVHSVSTSTLYVSDAIGSDTGDCVTLSAPCKTLGYAIDQAQDQDTILVGAGRLKENLHIDGKDLVIHGGYRDTDGSWLDANGTTIIDGNSAGRVFTILNSDVTLENLTVMGGDSTKIEPPSPSGGGAMLLEHGTLTVLSSTILDNQAPWGGAIQLRSHPSADGSFVPSRLVIEASTIRQNRSTDGVSAINVSAVGPLSDGTLGYGEASIAMTNTMVVSNTAGQFAPVVMLLNPANMVVHSSTIAGNVGNASVISADNNRDSEAISVVNSVIWGNEDPSLNLGQSVCTVRYSDIQDWPGQQDDACSGEGTNVNVDPQFVDPGNGDYHLAATSPVIDAGGGDGLPKHDFEGDPRPQNSGHDMGADEFVGTPVTVNGIRYVAKSGTDSGNPCTDPDAPCATVGHALDAANNDDVVKLAQGRYVENMTLPKSVELEGGYNPNNWADRDVTKYESTLDGSATPAPVMTVDGAGSLVLNGLTITGGNGPEAGGVQGDEADLFVRNCRIFGNRASDESSFSAGGGLVSKGNVTIISDSQITSNTAVSGASGVRVRAGTLTMTNTLVADNMGNDGIHLNSASGTLTNVTVVGNGVEGDRPGIGFNPEGSNAYALTIVNSIVFYNGASIHVPPAEKEQVIVKYSDIQDGWEGTGNIDVEPIFVDRSADDLSARDYHLDPWSPLINAGTGDGAPEADLDGDLRPQHAGHDIGMDEYTGVLPDSLVVTSSESSGEGTLRRAMEAAQSGDEISFDAKVFLEEEPRTILLSEPLPPLMIDNVTVDASGAGVILDGSNLATGNGITIRGKNQTIEGLEIRDFPGDGIDASGALGSDIEDNIVAGCNRSQAIDSAVHEAGADQTTVTGNEVVHGGIVIRASSDVKIRGNVISANQGYGIAILGEASADNVIVGNRIGTNISGTLPLGNSEAGLYIGEGAANNRIGGEDEADGNVISANGRAGIVIDGEGNDTANNTVEGNHIGTDLSGKKQLGNGKEGDYVGVEIHSSGGNSVRNNTIAASENKDVIIKRETGAKNKVEDNTTLVIRDSELFLPLISHH